MSNITTAIIIYTNYSYCHNISFSQLLKFLLCIKSMGRRGLRAVNMIYLKILLKNMLHNFTKYFDDPLMNQIVNKDMNGESSCLSNLSLSAS